MKSPLVIALLVISAALAPTIGASATVPFNQRLSPEVQATIVGAVTTHQVQFKAFDGTTITAVINGDGHLASASGTAKSGGLSKLIFPPWGKHNPLIFASAKFNSTIVSISPDFMTYTVDRLNSSLVIKLTPVYPQKPSGPFALTATVNNVAQPKGSGEGSQMAAMVGAVVEAQYPGFRNIVEYFEPVLLANSNDMASGGTEYQPLAGYRQPKDRSDAVGMAKRAGYAAGGAMGCTAYAAIGTLIGGPAGLAYAILSCGVWAAAASFAMDSVDSNGASSTSPATPSAANGQPTNETSDTAKKKENTATPTNNGH